MSVTSGGHTTRQNLNGLGDLQLLIQYDGFHSRNAPGGLTRLSGAFGIEAPTGAECFSPGAYQYTGGLHFPAIENSSARQELPEVHGAVYSSDPDGAVGGQA